MATGIDLYPAIDLRGGRVVRLAKGAARAEELEQQLLRQATQATELHKLLAEQLARAPLPRRTHIILDSQTQNMDLERHPWIRQDYVPPACHWKRHGGFLWHRNALR